MEELPGFSRDNSLAIGRLTQIKHQGHPCEYWDLFSKGEARLEQRIHR